MQQDSLCIPLKMWRKLIGPLAFVCLFVIQASVQQVRYANFIVDNFHYLNVSQVGSALVSSSIDCGHACLKVVSCFSFNFEAFPDGDGTFWCELLATDKYNASDKLEANQLFHHFSIFVSYMKYILIDCLCKGGPVKSGSNNEINFFFCGERRE